MAKKNLEKSIFSDIFSENGPINLKQIIVLLLLLLAFIIIANLVIIYVIK